MFLRILLPAALLCASAGASLVRLEVTERGGTPLSYERISGKAYFAVDPRLRQNRIIADIAYAPRNAQGKVEFSADFEILQPRDPHAGNGTVLFEVVNRGGRGILSFFDCGENTGELFLLRQGYTLAWLGWQWDVPRRPGLMRLYPVVARDNGKPITGLVRAEYTPDSRVAAMPLSDRGMIAYPALDPNGRGVRLTVRERVEGARRAIPRSAWRFGADGTSVEMDGGFEPGRIYEIVYRAKDPVVAGLGPAAVRDLVSHLKYGPGARVKRATGFGVSQCGRFLRSFLYWGFNEDEAGRKVFDGMLAHVAGAGRGSFNHRFAQPSRDALPIANTFYPTDIFPFTDLDETDTATGETDGLLRAAVKARVVPKIFYTNSSYEYYGRAASLIHTTPDGASDAPIADSTRIYLFAGGQHGPARFPPQRSQSQYPTNPDEFRWSMRALLVALQEWIAGDREPPPSQYPTIAAGTLVPLASVRFPKLAGIEFPAYIHKAYRVDYGPRFRSRGIVDIEPPRVAGAFPVLVPQVDADGNDLAGIRMPEVAVPLATYTGWNLRPASIGAPDEMATLVGSWFPFSRAKIEERYRGREDYLARVTAAARELAGKRYLLEADIPRIVERASKEWDHGLLPSN
ncbi:MAG: alpha/beta hydrolase domain-containing protein [Acidobacteriota bacterium]